MGRPYFNTVPAEAGLSIVPDAERWRRDYAEGGVEKARALGSKAYTEARRIYVKQGGAPNATINIQILAGSAAKALELAVGTPEREAFLDGLDAALDAAQNDPNETEAE